MFRTDDMYGDYPTLEEIKRDYNEFVDMVGNVITIEQAKEWDVKGKFTIEINGTSIDEFENGIKIIGGTRSDYRGTDKDIEWIRYESYGCLAYIYVYIKQGIVDDIVFDIWSNKWDSEFVECTSIGNIETNYDAYVDMAEKNWIE